VLSPSRRQTPVIAIVILFGGLGITFLFLSSTVATPTKCQADSGCYLPPTRNYYDGILQLYQHKAGGAIWSLESEPNLNACPYNSNCKVQATSGGWYTDVGAQNNIRNEVPAYPGYVNYKPAVHIGGMGPYDQNAWRSAGYMDTPKDWKNVEVSALFYLPPGTTEDQASYGSPSVDYVLRGGVNEDGYPLACLAQNYHVSYMPTGEDHGAKIERDIEHTAGYNAGQLTGNKLTNNDIPLVGTGKVFGYKVVIYNNAANTAVRMDAYLDTTGSGNQWKLIYSYVDDGHDPRIDSVRGQTHCAGLRPDLPVTFGGPLVGLRLNWSDAQFRQFTIQEIIPPRF
jgi:hypothetical protein